MQLVEKMAETTEEITAAGTQNPSKSLQQIENALAEAFRARPETLQLQIDHHIDDLDERLSAEVGRLMVLRTDVAAKLDDSNLSERSRRFAYRSLLEGAEVSFYGAQGTDLEQTPVGMLRDLLREEETADVLSREEMAEAWRAIFEIERERQHFPKAEDALFHAVDLAADPSDVIRAGLRFYERLSKLPDELLERRGLPREEVESGRAELESYDD